MKSIAFALKCQKCKVKVKEFKIYKKFQQVPLFLKKKVADFS